MRPVPHCAVEFVGLHEGLELESYADPGGTLTVGFGHTGRDVHAGLRITLDRASAMLLADLETAAAKLASVVDAAVIRNDLTDHQYAALLSFVFNLGADPKWTIWKRLNARQFDQVPVEMMRFTYVGKVKLQGLVNRRAAEVALWSTAEPGSVPDAPPSSFTRLESTPPVDAEPKALIKQGPFLAVAGAAILGAPTVIAQIIAALTPYAATPSVAHALHLLAAAAPVAAALGAVLTTLKNNQAKL